MKICGLNLRGLQLERLAMPGGRPEKIRPGGKLTLQRHASKNQITAETPRRRETSKKNASFSVSVR